MKLSTRGRYGIHAMYDLAVNAASGPVPIKVIAERQGIPEAYLEQLFGVVLDQNQNYVWVKGDKENEYEMDLSDVPSVFTSGTLDPEKLEEGVGKTIVDLSGCTLDEVLYFVSHDRPVLANTKEGVKCIVGYDEYNTYLLNPGEDEWYYYGIQDSTDLFLAAGNEFYSYIEK